MYMTSDTKMLSQKAKYLKIQDWGEAVWHKMFIGVVFLIVKYK